MQSHKTIRLAVAATFILVILVASCLPYGIGWYNERLRIQDAEKAFGPILPLGCNIWSQPYGSRYCRYILEFQPASKLSDENVSVLQSLRQLPSKNTLDLLINTPQVTDKSVPFLKSVHPFDAYDSLDVTNTLISDEGIAELAATFPKYAVLTRSSE